ncbi:MAG: DUF3383 family protein [Phascolarctobacterium sp.]|nr:DUF3383 family protein [Phascolarctobacterium sp.]MBR6636843.1 DUF3383 family protein [Phascolarctobacterium sp.]
MANIDRVVNVQIALNTAGISSEGFSTMMVVGPHAYGLERVLNVTDSDELLELGFRADDPIYIAVNDAFSQTPRPREVKVGRIQCDTTKIKLDGDVAVGKEYAVTINTLDEKSNLVEKTTAYIALEGDTAANVLEAIASVISQDADYNASVVGEEMSVKASVAENSYFITVNGLLEVTGFEKANISLAENMALITAADDDFYGIIYTSRKQADILEMADWTEAHTKLYATAISEAAVLNAEADTDTGSLLQARNYFRTHWWYHEKAETEFPEIGITARCFAVAPGGETWANKQLAGFTTNKLRENEYNVITKKNGNTFEPFRNISITQNGKVAAGEWIDVIRFRDWLEETIKTEMFSMLINRDKLPYIDKGIGLVESVLNSVLALGQRRGGIAPTEYDEYGNKNAGYVIEVPLAANISANVKAQRVLRDVKFTARLAGAIHVVEITGSLTYENLIIA